MKASFVAAVTAAALVPASAHAVTDGAYKGTIDDDTAPVTVKVKNGKLKKFTASIYASCQLSNFQITVAWPPVHQRGATKKIKNNRFRITFTGDPSVEDDKRTITGKFTGRTVKGSITVEGPCSAEGTYTAKR